MRIEIAEVRNRGVYQVWHDGELILSSTTTPLLSAARLLLERGADPGEMLEMLRRGSDRVDLSGGIGLTAGLGVEEGDHPPRFVRYRPHPGQMAFSHAASASPVAPGAPEATGQPLASEIAL